MDAAPDPRRNAYRDDLAAASLRGRVAARRFAEGERRQVVEASAPLRRMPRFDAPLDTEVLHGETLTVFDEREGWAWAQADRDAYVGYVPADALSRRVAEPTHTVAALRTYVYPAPDIKAPPLRLLSLGALVRARVASGRFAEIDGPGFVIAAHLRPRGEHAADHVAVAERFAGTPYLWGGRTSIGVDCSGLVQLALEAAGRPCPRDSDMQEAEAGEPLGDPRDSAQLRRGDLVFWPGHVGIMADARRLVHANAFHMLTTVEPLAEVAARNPDPIRTLRRP